MARPQNDAKKQALLIIGRTLAAGMDPSEVREQFPDVPSGTWRRWVVEVRQASPQAAKAIGTAKVPPQSSASQKPSQELDVREPEMNTDGTAAIIPTIFGPKIIGVTEALANPRELDVSAPLDYLRRLGILLVEAEALRDCAVQSVAGGTKHVILDANSFAKSIDLRRAINADIFKALKDAKSLTQMQAIVETVVKSIAENNPALAKRVLADLKAYTSNVSPELWPALKPPNKPR